MNRANFCHPHPYQLILRNILQKPLLIFILLFLGLSSFHASAAPSSLIFSSANSRYIDIADAPFQLPNGTWEAWFQVSSLSSDRQAIIAKDQTGYSDDGWLGIENNSSGGNSNKLYFYIDKSSGATAYPIYSDSAVVTGTWYHVAVTWGSSGMKMYVNGTLQTQTNANTSGMVSSGTNLRIGARDSIAGYNYFDGQIDEVRVWNVERTQPEINQYKGVTLIGNESGLLAYYRLDEGSGTTATDLAGSAQNGTLMNSPAWAATTDTIPVVYPPTTQTSAINFTSKTASSMTVNWTSGNGASRIVLMKSGSVVDSLPVTTTSYTANPAFGSGTQLGTGNYVVYQGTGTSVAVTGLTPNTVYHVAVYEFNGSGGTENYLTPGATGNDTTTKIAQIITFSAPTNLYVGQTEALSATADSGLTVTFGSNTPTICTVSGSTVSYRAVGTCTLTADQAGNTTYDIAPQVTSGVTILKGNQTISFNATTGTVGSSATPATATSNLPVTFNSSTSSICTASNSTTVTYIAAGTCSLTADQAGNPNYNPASPVIGSITITDPPPPAAPTYPLTNSTPASGQKIQFDTLVGQKQIKPITLKNFGSAALIFNSINTPIAPFSYPKPMPFTFIPTGDPTGSAKTLELSCTPTEMGLKTMTLQMTTNDVDNTPLVYPLECMGRLPVVVSSVANNSPLNFGNTLLNSTVSQSINFSENGNTDLIINSATITGANADQFQITAPTTFPITVADGATNSQIITVSCTPKTATPLTATLQITTNDPANATLNYPLQCGGLFSLTLNTSGQGTISGCGSSCVQNYQQDAVVNLSAVAATGWQLGSWSGNCVNGKVTMTGNQSCTANFTQVIVNPTTPSTTPTGTTTTPTNTTTTPSTPTIPTGTTGNSTATTPTENATTTTPTSPTGTTTGNNTSNPPPTGTSSSSDSDNMISVTAAAPTNNWVVSGAMSNYNQVATNLTVPENTSVSGGTLTGNTINNGLIANITVAPTATVTGGKFSGFNVNWGTLNNVTISPHSEVRYGNYSGITQNKGTLIEPIILPNGTMLNSGVVENPILLSDSHLIGGKVVGIIIALGGRYSEVQNQENIGVIKRVQDIPPEIFSRFNAQTLQVLPPEIISQISSTQFQEIPVMALKGLTSENMGAISPQVIQTLDKEQIQELNVEEFKAMPTNEVAKLLTNFDAEQITPAEAEKLLPTLWRIDQYGNLTAPPGIRIALRTLMLSELPAGLKLADPPDLNSSFALGGRGTHPVINQINQISGTEGFTLTQQKTGGVQAQEATQQKRQFSFMIDPDMIFLLDDNALHGLQMNEQGQYLIVTEDGKQIPITPMTKDPEALLKVLGDGGEVDILNSGEALLKFRETQRSREGGEVHKVGIFDPFIEPAPEGVCTRDEKTGETQCDWSKADAAQQPGLRSARNVRAGSNNYATAMAKVIYPDGTAQQIYPAVLSPNTLIAEAKKIPGVSKIVFRMDGTFAVIFEGVKLLLSPEPDTLIQPIDPEEDAVASLTLVNNKLLTYRVPYQGQWLQTDLVVSLFPEN